MQLRSFKVQGFKNFRQPVVLEDLGPINVLHGANNVGKSNLLQAIELFFVVIGLEQDQSIPLHGMVIPLSDALLGPKRLSRAEVFNLEAPAPIQIEAEVESTPEELARAGLAPALFQRVRIAIELRWMGTHVNYTIQRFETADARDFGVVERTHEESASLSLFAKLLAKNLRVAAEPADRFARLGVERLWSSELALALYDTKESPDIEVAQRWDRFVEAISTFEDILGKGTFIAAYDRRTGKANLFLQTPRARIPLQLLGTGVQQIVALLGTLLVSGATIAGIEEPELNLRYTLQLRLREVLARIVGAPSGISQLFITSHSDAFEAGSHFYLMEVTPDGPRVEKRKIDQARAAVGMTAEGALPDPNAVLCYLSTEGVVRVPERIRRALGLPNGGGLIFLQRDGGVEVMSDDTFADRFEPKRSGEGDEHT